MILGNYSVFNKMIGRAYSGASLSDSRGNFNKSSGNRNMYLSLNSGTTVPFNYLPPYCWVISFKNFLPTSGSTTITDYDLVISNVIGLYPLLSTLTGTSTFSALGDTIASGTSTTFYMSATITTYTDLSPENLTNKIWNSSSNLYTNDDTMGLLLNNVSQITGLISTQLTGITGDISNLSVDVNDISTQLTGLTSDVDRISTQLTGITSDISNLSVDVNDISTQLTGLTSGINNLSVDVNDISTQLTGITSDIVDISTQLTGLTSDMNNISIELSGITIDINDIFTNVISILGLSQHNYRLRNHIYDSDNRLLSCNIKLYNNKNDCDSDTNSFEIYQMSATYDANGQLTDYKVTKL